MEPVWPSHFQADVVREGFGRGLSTYTIALEAWRRGLTVALLDPTPRKIRVSDGFGRETTFVGARPTVKRNATVKDKHKTNQLLGAAGIPVPKSVLIDPQKVDIIRLKQHAGEIGYPVVLKLRDGTRGQGVFANITDASVLEARYAELLEASSTAVLVLERHVQGNDYRVLVYGKEYVAASLRIPANITGDGESTVDELIEGKNSLRRRNPFASSGLIKRDEETSYYLGLSGYDYQSIPSCGEYIQLRGAANASAGGDVVDTTERLPQWIRDSAINAVQAVPGLLCAGVDVIYDESAEQSKDHVVLELNGLPQIGVNMYPTRGNGIDVPKKIIDMYFPDSPRLQGTGDEQLSLSFRSALKPLLSGHASEVTLAPLPPSRYRSRLLYTLDQIQSLTTKQCALILRAARLHAVAGFIRRRGATWQLVAAGTEVGIDEFVDSFAAITACELGEPHRWTGALPSGFNVEV